MKDRQQVVLRNFDVIDYRPRSNGDGTNGHKQVGSEDPIADAMEVPFCEYDVHRLYQYFCNWYRKVFRREYDKVRPKDLRVLSGFIERYGAEMSAKIIQRLYLVYGGKWQGRPISTGTFARGSRWITDRIEQEVLTSDKRSNGEFRFMSLSVFSEQ